MDVLTNHIGAQIVSIIVAGACGWLGAQLSRLKKRDDALYEGMKAVLRKELVDDFERYVVEGLPFTIERKQEVDDCYAAYAELGGNGTGKQLYEKICAIKVTVVTAALEEKGNA